jgi:hypothetical protein
MRSAFALAPAATRFEFIRKTIEIELVEERRRRGASAARFVTVVLLICIAPTVGSGPSTVLVPVYLLNTAF